MEELKNGNKSFTFERKPMNGGERAPKRIVIEKNVPVPPVRQRIDWVGVYCQMAVGDSFVGTESDLNGLRGCAKELGVEGYSIAGRKLAKGTFRIWKLK